MISQSIAKVLLKRITTESQSAWSQQWCCVSRCCFLGMPRCCWKRVACACGNSPGPTSQHKQCCCCSELCGPATSGCLCCRRQAAGCRRQAALPRGQAWVSAHIRFALPSFAAAESQPGFEIEHANPGSLAQDALLASRQIIHVFPARSHPQAHFVSHKCEGRGRSEAWSFRIMLRRYKISKRMHLMSCPRTPLRLVVLCVTCNGLHCAVAKVPPICKQTQFFGGVQGQGHLTTSSGSVVVQRVLCLPRWDQLKVSRAPAAITTLQSNCGQSTTLHLHVTAVHSAALLMSHKRCIMNRCHMGPELTGWSNGNGAGVRQGAQGTTAASQGNHDPGRAARHVHECGHG